MLLDLGYYITEEEYQSYISQYNYPIGIITSYDLLKKTFDLLRPNIDGVKVYKDSKYLCILYKQNGDWHTLNDTNYCCVPICVDRSSLFILLSKINEPCILSIFSDIYIGFVTADRYLHYLTLSYNTFDDYLLSLPKKHRQSVRHLYKQSLNYSVNLVPISQNLLEQANALYIKRLDKISKLYSNTDYAQHLFSSIQASTHCFIIYKSDTIVGYNFVTDLDKCLVDNVLLSTEDKLGLYIIAKLIHWCIENNKNYYSGSLNKYKEKFGSLNLAVTDLAVTEDTTKYFPPYYDIGSKCLIESDNIGLLYEQSIKQNIIQCLDLLSILEDPKELNFVNESLISLSSYLLTDTKSYVIRNKQLVVGYLVIAGNFLHDFYIYPQYRTQGYGKIALKELLKKFKYIKLFVNKNNYIAQNLYSCFELKRKSVNRKQYQLTLSFNKGNI